MPNTDRLEETVLQYENTLYRAALSALGDPEEARDAVQNAFLALLERVPVFESPEHEKAWLLRVTINACRDRLRALRRHPTLPLLETYPAHEPAEETALEAVLALPPKERLCVHLFYYEGYKTHEIADMLGEREGTVRSRLSRARVRLRSRLEETI